jgi:hypothetical protein
MLVDPALIARAIRRLHPKVLPSEPGNLARWEGEGQASEVGKDGKDGKEEEKERTR